MPTFDNVEITTVVSVDFEVFCGTCGMGLCNQSNTRESRSRRYAQVAVDVCQNCLEEAREEIRRELEDQILELQNKLDKLGYNDD
jgi:hypothetical protein